MIMRRRSIDHLLRAANVTGQIRLVLIGSGRSSRGKVIFPAT